MSAAEFVKQLREGHFYDSVEVAKKMIDESFTQIKESMKLDVLNSYGFISEKQEEEGDVEDVDCCDVEEEEEETKDE